MCLQIAVIGGQSSGKSSVLEGIVGRDFFLRGDDIVTRCPLILEAEHNPTALKQTAFFNGEPVSFDSLKSKVQEITDAIPEGTVTDKPIVIRFVSKDVVTTRLIDLPGLTKIRVDGQDAGIVQTIRNMVKSFIADEN